MRLFVPGENHQVVETVVGALGGVFGTRGGEGGAGEGGGGPEGVGGEGRGGDVEGFEECGGEVGGGGAGGGGEEEGGGCGGGLLGGGGGGGGGGRGEGDVDGADGGEDAGHGGVEGEGLAPAVVDKTHMCQLGRTVHTNQDHGPLFLWVLYIPINGPRAAIFGLEWRADVGVDPEGPQRVVEVEDDHAGEGEAVGEGVRDEERVA